MAIWIKPNGNEIEINDKPANIQYAESLKWKRKGSGKQKPKKDKAKAE